jgi:hypothetical protein
VEIKHPIDSPVHQNAKPAGRGQKRGFFRPSADSLFKSCCSFGLDSAGAGEYNHIRQHVEQLGAATVKAAWKSLVCESLKGQERCRKMSSAKVSSIGKKPITQKRLESAAIEGQAGAEDTHQQPPASFIMKIDFLSLLLTTGAVNMRSGNLTVLDTLTGQRTNFRLKRYSHISRLCRWYRLYIPGPAFFFPIAGQPSRKWIAAWLWSREGFHILAFFFPAHP